MYVSVTLIYTKQVLCTSSAWGRVNNSMHRTMVGLRPAALGLQPQSCKKSRRATAYLTTIHMRPVRMHISTCIAYSLVRGIMCIHSSSAYIYIHQSYCIQCTCMLRVASAIQTRTEHSCYTLRTCTWKLNSSCSGI